MFAPVYHLSSTNVLLSKLLSTNFYLVVDYVWYVIVWTLFLLTLIYSLFPWIYLPEITHFLTRLKSAHHKVRWFGNVIKKLLVLSISPNPCPYNCLLLTCHGSTARLRFVSSLANFIWRRKTKYHCLKSIK